MKKALVLAAVMACATPAMAQVNFSENFESYTAGTFFNPVTSYTSIYSAGPGGWGYQQNSTGTGGTLLRNNNRLYDVQIINDSFAGLTQTLPGGSTATFPSPNFPSGNKLLLYGGTDTTAGAQPVVTTGGGAAGQWFRQVTTPGIDTVRGTRVSFLLQMGNFGVSGRSLSGVDIAAGSAPGNEFFLSLSPILPTGNEAFQNYISFKAGAQGTVYPVTGEVQLGLPGLNPSGLATGLAGTITTAGTTNTELRIPFSWDYTRVYSIAYEVSATGTASLYIDDVLALQGTSSAFVQPTGLQIRSQRTASVVDNLTVSSVPEPSAAMAAVVPAVAMLRRRRK